MLRLEQKMNKYTVFMKPTSSFDFDKRVEVEGIDYFVDERGVFRIVSNKMQTVFLTYFSNVDYVKIVSDYE